MNKYNYITCLFLLGFLLTLSSCDKTPVNGDLDGMWQLMTIQTPGRTLEVKERRAYVCIYGQLAEWRVPLKPGAEDYHYYSHFIHQGDSLCFLDLCHASTHTATGSDDRRVTAEEMTSGAMADWGIRTLHTRYRVLQLNTDHLTLQKADTLYAFRKF
ncbi:MAG: lipocalin-like domain-containing protein [Bacteroidaceae bacterium]|nr:lipocalin-like domain-containing protein [Bacteroidaceae bacterium]